MAIYNPVMEAEFYGDGQHNDGVYYWGNLNPYIYTYQNPIVYVDPNGKQTKGSQEARGVPMIQPRPIGVPTNIPTAPPASSPVSTPSPGFWGTAAALGTRLLAGGLLLFPGTLNAPTYNPQRPITKNPTDDDKDAYIYRGGAFSDTNFTPRPGKDDGAGSKSGLSTFVLPELATQGKEGKVQKLSVKKLVQLGFELNFDGIRPPSQKKLEEWAATRPEVANGGTPHLLTEMVKSARVGEEKVKPK